jgi:hypothetical protein
MLYCHCFSPLLYNNAFRNTVSVTQKPQSEKMLNALEKYINNTLLHHIEAE